MFVVIAGDSVFKCDDCLGPTSSTDKISVINLIEGLFGK